MKARIYVLTIGFLRQHEALIPQYRLFVYAFIHEEDIGLQKTHIRRRSYITMAEETFPFNEGNEAVGQNQAAI